jgi:hypothetical protein
MDRNLGTFIADKLEANNKSRIRFSIALTVFSDLFCLAVCFLESGFWAKAVSPNLTWNGLFSAGGNYSLKSDPISPILVSFDSDLPIPQGGGLQDILLTFIAGLILFIFLKSVITFAFSKAGFKLNPLYGYKSK